MTSNLHNIPVWRAGDFRVSSGVNEGDALRLADDLMLDDIFCLSADAVSARLGLAQIGGDHVIAPTTHLGRPGAPVRIECAVTLMDDRASVVEMLVLIEADALGRMREVYLFACTALSRQVPYTLVNIEHDVGAQKLAQTACVSLTRGTRIMLGSGCHCAVEDLRVDDPVLTRDDGIQRIRWIGCSTRRTDGGRAPVRITAGALNNARDLIVSPDDRLTVSRPSGPSDVWRAEGLIRADGLMHCTSVNAQHSGFVDYVHLLFDTPQILYAEGIAADMTLTRVRGEPARANARNQTVNHNGAPFGSVTDQAL